MDDGDAGFEAVWVAERERLWRVAWLICGEADLADDVVAAAAARSWRGWSRRPIRNPYSYLRRAVVHEATDRFRGRRRDRRWFDRRTGEGRGERELVEQIADHAVLAEALQQLPVEQRAVIVLRYWADLDERATAEALSVSVGTIKSRTHRALRTLRSVLGEEIQLNEEEVRDARDGS